MPAKGPICGYVASERLWNDTPVTIRAIRPEDKDRLYEAFKNLEESLIRQRFFGTKRALSEQGLAAATQIDFVRNVALVA